MRHRGLYLVIVALLGAPALTEAAGDAAAWQAEQQAVRRATAAEHALSDRYAAIWPTLDTAQKSKFSAHERAWLNEGRETEREACIARAAARTALVAITCEADVIERHLGTLGTPQRVTVSG